MGAYFALYFPGLDATYELDPCREVVAGISATCDLDLRSWFPESSLRTISRRHFKLVCTEDQRMALYDLESLNGTRVNGVRVAPGTPVALQDGDVLTLAENDQFVMEVVCHEGHWTEPISPAALSAPESFASFHGLLHRTLEGEYVLDGQRIPHEHLTTLEHRLLDYLYEHSGRVCSYDALIRNVWEYAGSEGVQNNSVAKMISNLRKKLDHISSGSGARHIQTVHGRGVKCIPV